MPKQQSSLDSFFGTGVKVKKQKTLTSFFNSENSDENDKDKVPQKVVDEMKIVSKRRAIVDDESDEDVPAEMVTTVITLATSTAASSNKNGSTHDIMERTTKTSPKVTPPPPTEDVAPIIRSLQAQSNKLVQQAKVSTDDELEALASPALYEDVVKVFEQIEAISSRLEIQSILTTFFRRLLRDSPHDLYHVVYLASNSIAPAYECVELGIGDSILMKAIGEAYGTKASKWTAPTCRIIVSW